MNVFCHVVVYIKFLGVLGLTTTLKFNEISCRSRDINTVTSQYVDSKFTYDKSRVSLKLLNEIS